MIREVIRREFGVALSVVSVGRLLRKLGMSPQRPLHRAYQQNPEAVGRSKREQYPAIQAQAEAAGAVIYFADEAGIRSDYHAGTTWSPVGQTPEVKNTGARYSVNMISVVSAKGALRFAVYEGNTNAAIFIDFCKRLLHDAPGPVYLIVDRRAATALLPRRNSYPVQRQAEAVLPASISPPLNPDEWVWKNVKHDRIGKTGVTSKEDLKSKAIGALRRLQKRPGLVQAFSNRRSLRWFGLPTCIGEPGGPNLHHWHSTVRAGDLLHRLHSPFRTHRRTADIARCTSAALSPWVTKRPGARAGK